MEVPSVLPTMVMAKPRIGPNRWPGNNSKYQCVMTSAKDGNFTGYGNNHEDAWNDMWLQYEMYCDPDLHK